MPLDAFHIAHPVQPRKCTHIHVLHTGTRGRLRGQFHACLHHKQQIYTAYSHAAFSNIYCVYRCNLYHLLHEERSMLVTKTEAAELAGISRRTLYNHIPQKKISVTTDKDGGEKIDVSELERIYGKETIASNLKAVSDREGEGVASRKAARATQPESVQYETMLLKEKVKGLEESKELLEKFSERERDQLQEEIQNLRDSLKLAQNHHAQLSVLLTHHKDEKESRGGETDQKIGNLETTVQEMRKMNRRIINELKKERAKSFWQKIFR